MKRLRACALPLLLALVAPGTALAAAPVNETPPAVSGAARDGQVLSSTTGTWSGDEPITYKRQWRRCDADGANCLVLNATTASLTLTSADVGARMQVRVEATGPGGVTYAQSDPTEVVAALPPNHTAAPVVSGALRVGQVLSATQGSWSGSQPIAFDRRWRRCAADGGDCVSIPGATGSQYLLTAEDLGTHLRHQVIGTNPGGSDEGNSLLTAAVGPAQPPVATTDPSLSGTPMDRQTLSVARGTWTGAAPIAYTQRWSRCNALSGACQAIPGATAATYTLTSSDVGSRMQAEVTATNPDGTLTRSTAPSAEVAPAPPASTAPPTVTGATRVGQTLTAAPGTWTGTPAIAYAYAWERCASDGTGCAPIADATERTYDLADADLGARIAARVTASNAAGSASRLSSPSNVIAPLVPPSNTVAPALTGTPRDGQSLTAGTGTWTGTAPLTYTRQWRRCTPACADVPGAVDPTYRLTPADVGAEILVRVTARNPDGTAAADSAPMTIAATPPRATVAPSLTGAARDGELLTGADGTWTGTPTLAFTRRWEACRGTTCEPIAGATGTTLRLGPEHIGARIALQVTATNAAGPVSATSAATVAVEAAPPLASPAPSVRGVAEDGSVLSGDRGTWTGTAPIEYVVQWRRCGPTGGQCVDIPGETGATYALTPADVGKVVRLRVRATNVRASTTVESLPSAAVQPLVPSSTARPEIAGTVADGSELTASPGAWRGTPTLVFGYQWQRCGSADCTDIPGATAATYRLTSADTGVPVRVRVTAANAGGTSAADSVATAPVDAVAPASTSRPAIAGSVTDGALLTAAPGTWTGTGPQERSFAWRRCDPGGDGCVAIAGATQDTYRLTRADVGATLRVRVTAVNVAGSASVESDRTALVGAAPPTVRVAPAISGEARDGGLLSVEPGAWDGTAPIAYAYRWQRCSQPPTGAPTCTDVEGATLSSHRLRTADVGARMRVVLVASNPGGSTTHVAAFAGEVLPSPPVNVTRPLLSGVPRDGEELTVSDGAWSGVVTFAYAYRWFRCDAAGESCGIVPGADRRTYRLTGADTTYTIRAEVVARNPGGATAALSGHTVVSAPSAPGSLAPPTVTGHVGVGLELTADDGGWSGSVPMDFTRRWLRCGAGEGDPCAPIDGETRRAYRLTAEDLGSRIAVEVRAANAAGSATATSGRTRVIRDDPPVNASPPDIAVPEIAADGARLVASEGDWGTNGPFEASFRWRRCDAGGNACADIPGATGRTYDPGPQDVGSTLRVTVTMDNGVGAAEATSDAVGPIRPAPPANAVAPAITVGGPLLPGTALTASGGTWTGGEPIALSYEWLRCDAAGQGCEPIPGSGATKHTLGEGDVGRALRVRVSATNPTTRRTATSEPTAPVTAKPPAATGKVAIAFDGGKPRIGVRARGEGGAWTGTEPLRYRYRWQRCSSATDCQDVPGAEGIEHTLEPADVGRRMRFVVVAENAAGGASLASPVSEPVAGTAPAAVRPPAIAVDGGRLVPDGALVADAGEWAGTGAIELGLQWQRCKASGTTCKAIPRATAGRYVLTPEDVGQRISLLVTARSPHGRADAESRPTEPVAPIAPGAQAVPVVTRPPGTLAVGSKLTATPGEWTGTGPLTYEYAWLRCTLAGRTCKEIPKATKATYALEAADFRGDRLGFGLRVAVTARNAAGSAVQRSLVLGRGASEDGRGGKKRAKRTKPAKPAKAAAGAARVSARFARRRLALRIACPKGRTACAGTVTVQLKGLKARSVPFSLKAGKARSRVLKLTAGERKAAARARRVKGTVTVTGAARKSRRVVLRWR